MDNSFEKNCQTKTNSFEKNPKNSKTKPNFFESDDGKVFCNNNFQNFLNDKIIKNYSTNTNLGAVIPELFNRIIREFFRRPVFERGDANLTDVLRTRTKHNNMIIEYLHLLN